jgi:hypothetical protein
MSPFKVAVGVHNQQLERCVGFPIVGARHWFFAVRQQDTFGILYECSHELGIFLPRFRLDAAGDIDAPWAGQQDRISNIAGV